MRVEIISCGTELLLGSIVNTNARFLSQILAENALDVHTQVTVGDNIERLTNAFSHATNQADIAICSGGLGPTEDDVTAQALANFLNVPLQFHRATYQHILKKLKKHHFKMTDLVKRQCFIPEGAQVIQNDFGTAPGILCKMTRDGVKRWLLLLPGPPRELEPMFLKKALPPLLKEIKIKKEYFIQRKIKISGLAESEVAEKVIDLLKLRPPATVGIYARLGEVELKIMSKSKTLKKANKIADSIEYKIRARFKKRVFGVNEETLASVSGQLLKKHKKTIAIAESCTGGLISNLMTDTPGSSDYFLGGLTSYHNKIKISQLGVEEKLLKRYGAVSAPVAKKMAKNIKTYFNSDYGIGITGIAGPAGGSTKKPVGLVYIAVSDKSRIICHKCHFFGTRQEIKMRAALEALDIFRLFIT